VLRAKADDPAIPDHLLRALNKIYSVYGNCRCDCTLTCNVILRHQDYPSFSLFFGQDFGEQEGRHDLFVGRVYEVNNLGDVTSLPTSMDQADFEAVFNRVFTDTDVFVYGIVNLVWKFSRYLSDAERNWTTPRSRWRRLF
jgi:hypothetical protein